MKNRSLFILTFFILTSCTQPSAHSKKNAELEIVVQKMKSEVESLKHDIRCQNMEIRIVEGKLNSAQETLCVFKNEIINNCQSKLALAETNIKSLEQSSFALKKEQESMQEGLKILDFKADSLTKSLNICKNKVKNIQSSISKQEPALSDEKKSNPK